MLNLNFSIMKINKYLLVAAASVMMFSCAKNDDVQGLADEGPVALTINLANSGLASKAGFTDGAAEGQTILQYKPEEVEVTLHYGNDETVTENLDADLTHTFYNIENPQYVEVSINGGVETYDAAAILALKNTEAAAMPAYGKSAQITEANYVGTITGEGEDADTEYKEYAVTVYAQIPVARLEMGGIHHVDEGTCLFGSLHFDQVVLRGGQGTATYREDGEESVFVGETGVFGSADLTLSVDEDFTVGTNFPADGCYAFNFPVGALVVAFDFTDANGDTQYAIVENFLDAEGKTVTFEAGKIYQIKTIEITDEDLTPDYEGNKTVAVTVTVEVQDWAIVSMSDVVFK